MTATEVFAGSDGEVTRAYYKQLEERGAIGLIAINLFRAQKCSTRAKVYRGGLRGKGSFRSMAYDRKNYSISELCRILTEHGAARDIRWGWKEDVWTPGFEWVLYIDLPQGQVSFHSSTRGQGPIYPGDWDKQHLSRERIIAFCDNVMAERRKFTFDDFCCDCQDMQKCAIRGGCQAELLSGVEAP